MSISYLKINFSKSWTRVEKTLAIPSNVTEIELDFCVNAAENGPTGENARAWFDDLEIIVQ